LKTSLLKGLDEKEAKEMKGLFIEAQRLRRLIQKRLEEKKSETQAERLSKVDYATGSWAYKQAELNGYERGIVEFLSLLDD
jgi:uncharacterized protein YutD